MESDTKRPLLEADEQQEARNFRFKLRNTRASTTVVATLAKFAVLAVYTALLFAFMDNNLSKCGYKTGKLIYCKASLATSYNSSSAVCFLMDRQLPLEKLLLTNAKSLMQS